MLKYYSIIKQLSDEDKIKILSNIKHLSDVKYRSLGIPSLKAESMEAWMLDKYPSYVSLSNSWDTELIGQVSEDVIKSMASKKVNLITLPGPKIKINPFRTAISEDPTLASAISRESLAAANRVGVSAALSRFYLHADEAKYLDKKPDMRAIKEMVEKPFMDATVANECVGFFTRKELNYTEYASVNDELYYSHGGENGRMAICHTASAENTVKYIANDVLFFEGSGVSLEAALGRYYKLKKAIQLGKSTQQELDQECKNYTAISPDVLDSAIDRRLDFAFSLKKCDGNIPLENEELVLRANRESTVMLKNDGHILPIAKKARVAIVGDIAMQEDSFEGSLCNRLNNSLVENGYNVVGTDQGYDFEREHDKLPLEKTVELAKNSDVILMFLGHDSKQGNTLLTQEKLAIPANQLNLIDKLSQYSSKIVAILPSDSTFDVAFADKCAAILLLPIGTKYSHSVLTEILSGSFNPCGKLANTVYINGDRLLRKKKNYRERDNIKVGQFVGYREYDTAGIVQGFSFGHGIGYSDFVYSKLKLSANKAQFYLKNTGKYPAAEVVQLYVGTNNSSVIRPKKVLSAFERVELAPGEKKLVTVNFDFPRIYDEKKKDFVFESVEYTVYIGSSATDIRLEGKITAGNETLSSDNKKLSDYIQSYTNVFDDQFKLEARHKPMKKSVFHIIVGFIAIGLAIALKLYCVFNNVETFFFDIFAVVLAAVGVGFFILEASIRNKNYHEQQEKINEENHANFEEAEKLDVYSVKSMFVKEFDTEEELTESAAAKEEEENDSEYWMHIDKSYTFADAASGFENFAAEKGYKFDSRIICNIFSAMAASRLIVVDGLSNDKFQTLLVLLGNYFESSAYIDSVNNKYTSDQSVLFTTDSSGARVKTHFCLALDSARNNPHIIHFAGLSNVAASDLPNYFSAFVRYAANPSAYHSVSAVNENNVEITYNIPKNIWFVLNLTDKEAIDNIPKFIMEVASVIPVEFLKCDPAHRDFHPHHFTYYQFEYLVDRVDAQYSVDEALWKKIDRVEEYASQRTEYHIHNKTWLCLEKYALVYLACGGEMMDAIDFAMRAKLVPSIISALKKLEEREHGLVDTFEMIFGEDEAETCKTMIKLYASDIA
jgi:beta-glucosidase